MDTDNLGVLRHVAALEHHFMILQCSPGMLWPVSSARHQLEWGRLGEVVYGRPSGPDHRLAFLL